MLNRTSIALVSSIIAMCAWGMVGLFGWTIHADEIRRSQEAEDVQKAKAAEISLARTHSLAQDTVEERIKLQKLLDVDVVSASYMIEEVGKASGVVVKLGNAVQESVPSPEEQITRTIGFVVNVEGKFSALMKALRMFETLPIPSHITSIDIERMPSSSGAVGTWHMNLYIRALTASDTSS